MAPSLGLRCRDGHHARGRCSSPSMSGQQPAQRSNEASALPQQRVTDHGGGGERRLCLGESLIAAGKSWGRVHCRGRPYPRSCPGGEELPNLTGTAWEASAFRPGRTSAHQRRVPSIHGPRQAPWIFRTEWSTPARVARTMDSTDADTYPQAANLSTGLC